jgi:hypothetical protein
MLAKSNLQLIDKDFPKAKFGNLHKIIQFDPNSQLYEVYEQRKNSDHQSQQENTIYRKPPNEQTTESRNQLL